jgi:Gpi18-like mannosyltransferase
MSDMVKQNLLPAKWGEGFIFVFSMWLLSRLLIFLAMGVIAPLVPQFLIQVDPNAVPNFIPALGWKMFTHFDGGAYLEIATSGYNYANGRGNVVWFPLFPLVISGVMKLGIPSEVAGTLVNNFAFLGALVILHSWVKEHSGIVAARWTIAVLAWCPFSLFGTVIYTEGLFLLVTTAALRAFDRGHYRWAILWGAMATATRVPGTALVPAFLFVSWKEKRPTVAYITAFAVGIGLIAFSLYCGFAFGDFLAFVHGQKAWQQASSMFKEIRQLINVLEICGCGYLLWRMATKLPRVTFAYGFCYLLLILISGAVVSVNRFLYVDVALPFALGVLFARYPRWGYLILLSSFMFLVVFSIRFAWRLWVA